MEQEFEYRKTKDQIIIEVTNQCEVWYNPYVDLFDEINQFLEDNGFIEESFGAWVDPEDGAMYHPLDREFRYANNTCTFKMDKLGI